MQLRALTTCRGGVTELPLVVNLAGTMLGPKAAELTTSDGNLGAEL